MRLEAATEALGTLGLEDARRYEVYEDTLWLHHFHQRLPVAVSEKVCLIQRL